MSTAVARAVEQLRQVVTGQSYVQEPRRLPVKHIALQALAMWLVTRLLLAVLTLYIAPGLPIIHSSLNQVPPVLAPAASYRLPGPWFDWDALWYVMIGVYGYESWVGPAGLTSFFPFYPLQIHLATLLVGPKHAAIAAMALSNLATLAAFVGLGLLAVQEGDSERTAWNLIKVVAAYPVAYFLFAPYTEGTFLACVVFCFFCARRGSWWWAALCAFLAGLTRPTAVALVLPLAWEYGRQHGWWRLDTWRARWRVDNWRRLLPTRRMLQGVAVVGAMPAALGCFMLFCGLRYGDPLLFNTSQTLIHGHVSWPIWQTLKELVHRFLHQTDFGGLRILLFLDGGTLLLFAGIVLANVRKLPFLYTLYMLGLLYLQLTVPIPRQYELVGSAARYLLPSVPVFLLLARWMERRPWLELLLVGGGFLLQALFALLFINGYWIE